MWWVFKTHHLKNSFEKLSFEKFKLQKKYNNIICPYRLPYQHAKHYIFSTSIHL